ncbi:MAG TPA: MerR family transcriptional regulator [Ktedonobacteraceae bacterium]|nr:MerR family transcriptional regulator [Ktedonobacteraceae bacterium]
MQEESEQRFSIEELAEQVDLPVRTIRYYIAEGLAPGPGARGKAAAYGEEQLLRLRLIKRLSRQHMPLAEMQQFLSHLSTAEIRSLLEEEEMRVRELEQSDQKTAAKDYLAGLLKHARAARRSIPEETRRHEPGQGYSQPRTPSPVPGPAPSFLPLPTPAPGSEVWRHWELAPGVELHIRSDAEYRERGLIERLFNAAGMIFRPSSSDE